MRTGEGRSHSAARAGVKPFSPHALGSVSEGSRERRPMGSSQPPLLPRRNSRTDSPLVSSARSSAGRRSSFQAGGAVTNPMQVFVRVRCFQRLELERNSSMQPTVEVSPADPSHLIVLDPQKGFQKSSCFAFTHCFDSLKSTVATEGGRQQQEDVYALVGLPVLKSTLEGYNGCIFAYGQTGSGKTYTMYGDGDHDQPDSVPQLEKEGLTASSGIIPRLSKNLLESLEAKKEADECCSYRVEVSFYEIYQEKVYDLLPSGLGASSSPSSSQGKSELRIRHHALHGPYVEGIRTRVISNYSEVSPIIQQGMKARHTAATKFNDRSSRSHAIISFSILQVFLDSEGQTTGISSTLNLVDLAGSERTGAAGSEGVQLKDGISINLSLTVLGRVIDTLADCSQRGSRHSSISIPYRESKLTWILSDSLGGNSKTAMIATISPHISNYEEMKQTLRYASRAREIVNLAIINEDPHIRRIKALASEVERLSGLLAEREAACTNRNAITAAEEDKAMMKRRSLDRHAKDKKQWEEFRKDTARRELMWKLLLEQHRRYIKFVTEMYTAASKAKVLAGCQAFTRWGADSIATHQLIVNAFQAEVEEVHSTTGEQKATRELQQRFEGYEAAMGKLSRDADLALQWKDEKYRMMERNFLAEKAKEEKRHRREVESLKRQLERAKLSAAGEEVSSPGSPTVTSTEVDKENNTYGDEATAQDQAHGPLPPLSQTAQGYTQLLRQVLDREARLRRCCEQVVQDPSADSEGVTALRAFLNDDAGEDCFVQLRDSLERDDDIEQLLMNMVKEREANSATALKAFASRVQAIQHQQIQGIQQLKEELEQSVLRPLPSNVNTVGKA